MTKMFKHSHQLRPDVGIEVELPEDLTMKDVTRMGRWLGTLPFDQRRTRGGFDAPRDQRRRGEGKKLEIEDVVTDLKALIDAEPSVIMEAMSIKSLSEIMARGATSVEDKWLRAVADCHKLRQKLEFEKQIREGTKELLDQVVLESHELLSDLVHIGDCNLDGAGSCASHGWNGESRMLRSCPHPRGNEFLKELGKMVNEIELEKRSDDSGD